MVLGHWVDVFRYVCGIPYNHSDITFAWFVFLIMALV